VYKNIVTSGLWSNKPKAFFVIPLGNPADEWALLPPDTLDRNSIRSGDIVGLRSTIILLSDLKFNGAAFCQSAVLFIFGFDFALMHEHVVSAILRCDEAKAFIVAPSRDSSLQNRGS